MLILTEAVFTVSILRILGLSELVERFIKTFRIYQNWNWPQWSLNLFQFPYRSYKLNCSRTSEKKISFLLSKNQLKRYKFDETFYSPNARQKPRQILVQFPNVALIYIRPVVAIVQSSNSYLRFSIIISVCTMNKYDWLSNSESDMELYLLLMSHFRYVNSR